MAECNDERCPVHGSLSTYGLEITGTVVSNKARRTVVVEREYTTFIPKYERYAKKRSKLHAHLPECMNVEPGDIVRLKQCRRLSKTKHWVVIEKVGQ
ncbi:MAG: 30S ribosomal protein S17 [Candidatus Micrarchaeia archaeon]